LGLISGLLFCGLLLAARIILLLVIPEATRDTDDYRLMFNYGQVGAAALMQIIPAVVAATWVKRFGVLHGLLAAFVGGCVMAVGIGAFSSLVNRQLNLDFIRFVFLLVVNGGALLSLPASLVVASLAGWVRQLWSAR
jgi:phosphotransferase system  glucose/maltose/N-acetylglucosamine-specific IIC component